MSNFVDNAEVARVQFTKALKAHLKALETMRETQNDLVRAEEALYKAYVDIRKEYRLHGVDLSVDNIHLPLNMRTTLT